MYWINYLHVFKLSKRTEEPKKKTNQKEDQMTMSGTCQNA